MIELVSFAKTAKSNFSMKFTRMVALFLLVHAVSFATPISPNLTAVFDQEKTVIKLKWQTNDPAVNSYVLQKSTDNNRWADLFTLSPSDFTETTVASFTDRFPDNTKNFYRLKMIKQHVVELSTAITLIMGQSTGSWIIFPVPVKEVLNLQYTGSENITSAISIFIQNSNGKILTRFRASSINRIIQVPVANLGKGIYDVRIMIQDRIVWNQRFIK